MARRHPPLAALRDANVNALAQLEVTHTGTVAPQHRLQFKGTFSLQAPLLRRCNPASWDTKLKHQAETGADLAISTQGQSRLLGARW